MGTAGTSVQCPTVPGDAPRRSQNSRYGRLRANWCANTASASAPNSSSGRGAAVPARMRPRRRSRSSAGSGASVTVSGKPGDAAQRAGRRENRRGGAGGKRRRLPPADVADGHHVGTGSRAGGGGPGGGGGGGGGRGGRGGRAAPGGSPGDVSFRAAPSDAGRFGDVRRGSLGVPGSGDTGGPRGPRAGGGASGEAAPERRAERGRGEGSADHGGHGPAYSASRLPSCSCTPRAPDVLRPLYRNENATFSPSAIFTKPDRVRTWRM